MPFQSSSISEAYQKNIKPNTKKRRGLDSLDRSTRSPPVLVCLRGVEKVLDGLRNTLQSNTCNTSDRFDTFDTFNVTSSGAEAAPLKHLAAQHFDRKISNEDRSADFSSFHDP